jgi:hypothetical protein
MAKIKIADLTSDQRTALEKALRHGRPYSFRQRCLIILLKAEQRTSKSVAAQVGGCEVVVNSWRKRYQEQAPDSLQTKAGQGRLPILKTQNGLFLMNFGHLSNCFCRPNQANRSTASGSA